LYSNIHTNTSSLPQLVPYWKGSFLLVVLRCVVKGYHLVSSSIGHLRSSVQATSQPCLAFVRRVYWGHIAWSSHPCVRCLRPFRSLSLLAKGNWSEKFPLLLCLLVLYGCTSCFNSHFRLHFTETPLQDRTKVCWLNSVVSPSFAIDGQYRLTYPVPVQKPLLYFIFRRSSRERKTHVRDSLFVPLQRLIVMSHFL